MEYACLQIADIQLLNLECTAGMAREKLDSSFLRKLTCERMLNAVQIEMLKSSNGRDIRI